jgi:pimeloyl-ACP methyl ester carboxylesterase
MFTTQTILLCLMAALTGADPNKMTIHEPGMHYVSSEDSSLNLYATCLKTDDKPKPILAYLHGWHGNRYIVDRDLGKNKFMLDRYFLIGMDMRGRGSSGRLGWHGTPDPAMAGKQAPESEGTPDSNGWELNDIVDAIEEVKRRYPQHVIADRVYVIGHSGGGGNTMGIIGKFPDYFCAAYAGSGMSDFGRWAQLTSWRGSIENWVGAKLDENPSAFASRGGLTTVANRITPIALSHGTADVSVPFELSQVYVDANAKLGKPIPFKVAKDAGHGVWGHYDEMVQFMDQYQKAPQLPSKGKLVVAGYVKTKLFQILSASIDSTMNCEYNQAGSLTLHLTGGEKGTVTLRYPAGRGMCTVNGKSIDKVETWHGWQQVKFEYSGTAEVVVQ